MDGNYCLHAREASAHVDKCPDHILCSSTIFLAVCLLAAWITPESCVEIAALAPPHTALTASRNASPCRSASDHGSPSGKKLLSHSLLDQAAVLRPSAWLQLSTAFREAALKSTLSFMYKERLKQIDCSDAPKWKAGGKKTHQRQHLCCFSPSRDPATASKRQTGGRGEGTG